jgi:hypothetical protein
VLALYIVIGIALLVIILLSIPIEMAFDYDALKKPGTRIKLRWLFGIIHKDMAQKESKPEKKVKKKKKRSIAPFINLLTMEGLSNKIITLIRQLLRQIRIKKLNAELKFGLDDPADTALLYSVLWPSFLCREASGNIRIVIEPSFEEPGFGGKANLIIGLIPIKFIRPIFRFVFSLTGIRFIKTMASLR